MNLHVTGEILNYQLGGIATVLNELYNHSKNSKYLFCCLNTDQINLPKDILYCNIEDIGEFTKSINYDNIIFHNFFLAFEWMKKNKCNDNVYYVMHSNIFIEKIYKFNTFSNNDLDNMANIIENMNIIVISNYEKNLLIKICSENKIKYKKILVIPNGFNFKDNNLYIENKKINFGYIGRLDFRKGLSFLYEYWKDLDFNLLVSSGGFAKYSKFVYEDLCNFQSSNIIHLGFCTGNRKENFFKNINALIIPSFYEPFGMVLLECINENKLPLCNKTGGLLEILGEDYPFYFEIEDKDSFYKCLSKFINYKNKEELLFNTKNNIIKNYSIENMVNLYDSI